MFGFQRIGDFIWAAATCGRAASCWAGTAGRTTFPRRTAASGWQPTAGFAGAERQAYDPRLRSNCGDHPGWIRRMYKDGESIFYYLTVMNEPYAIQRCR